MSHEAEIPIPASFSNQFTTFIHVFCTWQFRLLKTEEHLPGNACIICARLVSTSQIALHGFCLAKPEKIFRQACNVILITVSISAELSYSPNHKVLINCNIDS